MVAFPPRRAHPQRLPLPSASAPSQACNPWSRCNCTMIFLSCLLCVDLALSMLQVQERSVGGGRGGMMRETGQTWMKQTPRGKGRENRKDALTRPPHPALPPPLLTKSLFPTSMSGSATSMKPAPLIALTSLPTILTFTYGSGGHLCCLPQLPPQTS